MFLSNESKTEDGGRTNKSSTNVQTSWSVDYYYRLNGHGEDGRKDCDSQSFGSRLNSSSYTTVVAGKDSVGSTSMCRKQPKMWNLHDALESRKIPLDQDSLTLDSVLNDTAARKSMSHLSSRSPKRLNKKSPNAPNCIRNENALDYPTMMIERPIGMMIERPIDRFASLHKSTQAQSTSRCKIRSKNIPIKESRSIDGLPSLNNSMEQVYDFATWRMYHRIANSRAMNEEQSSVNKQRNLGCLKKAKRCATMRSESIQAPDLIPVSSPEEMPLLDGEVFHLDI